MSHCPTISLHKVSENQLLLNNLMQMLMTGSFLLILSRTHMLRMDWTEEHRVGSPCSKLFSDRVTEILSHRGVHWVIRLVLFMWCPMRGTAAPGKHTRAFQAVLWLLLQGRLWTFWSTTEECLSLVMLMVGWLHALTTLTSCTSFYMKIIPLSL